MALSKPARTFQDLLVWQKAHQFVLGVYALTAAFPKPETYGLSLQMRRAAVSIPANIAEGFRRRGKADKARFMNIAEGSVEECRYFLILAKDLGYGDTERLAERLRRRHSGFWLLTPSTPISRRDIKGAALALLSR
jgi:four helix bundle protein